MKAVVIEAPGRVSVTDRPKPAPQDGEVVLKIRSVGLCGSDLKSYAADNPLVQYPRIPGHEIAGIVEQLGETDDEALRPGMQVTVFPYKACGKCSACRMNRPNCCKNNQTLGVQRDGAAMEYFLVPRKDVVPVSGLSIDQIVCIEPLSIGWHAAERARIKPRETVLVLGCGLVGLGVIAAGSSKGAQVIAADMDDAKLALAETMGASQGINVSRPDHHALLRQILGAEGPEIVVEAVGSPATFKMAIDCVCYGGRVVYIGYVNGKVDYEPRFFVSKELDIMGSRNATPANFEAVCSLLRSGRVDVQRLITQRYPLSEAAEALRFWNANRNRVTKIVLES